MPRPKLLVRRIALNIWKWSKSSFGLRSATPWVHNEVRLGSIILMSIEDLSASLINIGGSESANRCSSVNPDAKF